MKKTKTELILRISKKNEKNFKKFLDKLTFLWYVVCMIKINDIIRDPILGSSFRVFDITNDKALAYSIASGGLFQFPLHRLVLVGDHPNFSLWVRD